MAVVQPDPKLQQAVLDLLRTRQQDVTKRVRALPALGAAGFTGNQGAADFMLPKYDDPRKFELMKLQMKQAYMQKYQELQNAKLKGAAALSQSMKAQSDLYQKTLHDFLFAATKDEEIAQKYADSWNDNYASLQRARMGSMIRAMYGNNASGAGTLRIVSAIQNDAQTALKPPEDLLDALRTAIIEQEGWALGDPQKAPQTLDEALYAVNYILEQETGRGIDETLSQFTDPRFNYQSIQQAWDRAKNNRGAGTAFQAKIMLETSKLADEAAANLVGPQNSNALNRGLQAFSLWSGKMGITPEPDGGTASFEKTLSQLAPEGDKKASLDQLERAIDEIDRMSPNFSPGSQKARIFDPNTEVGKSFHQWMLNNGFDPSAPDQAWSALRNMIKRGRSDAARHNRAVARSFAEGRVDATTGPTSADYAAATAPEKDMPLDQQGATRSPDVSIGRSAPIDAQGNETQGKPYAFTTELPEFYWNQNAQDGQQLWYLSADKKTFRPATPDEYASVDAMMANEGGSTVNTDYASGLKQFKDATGGQAPAAAATPSTPAVDKAAVLKQAEDATPGKAALPAVGAAVARAGDLASTPSYTVQRAFGQAAQKARDKWKQTFGPKPEPDPMASWAAGKVSEAASNLPVYASIFDAMQDPEKLRKILAGEILLKDGYEQ